MMLRKDRAVTNRSEIVEILNRCDTLRIGFHGEAYPYVLPVSFGIREEQEQLILYFHGAGHGMKAELAVKYPEICFEGDIFYRVEELPHGITARYESVIGFGKITRAEGHEVAEGLSAICAHYGKNDFPVEACKSLPATAVYKILVREISGKRNLPQDGSAK